MKKVVLLLIALTIAPWARTWEDAEAFDYRAWFEDDSLGTNTGTDRLTEDDTLGIYFYAGYDSNDDSMFVLREYYSLGVRNDSNNTGDSIWISKYWMDDSLRESSVVMNANVDPGDFRPLTFDSLHTEYDLWPLLDERAVNSSWLKRKSLFFLYKKDSSYYALCQIGGPVDCLFYLSCQFQDDGTTNFEKIPDVQGVDFACPTSLPRPARRIPARLRESVPYLVNGARSRGGASSVIIRNGQPEVKLGE
jgi:hypothetical protein